MVNDIRDFLNTHDFGKDVDAFGVPLEDKYRSTFLQEMTLQMFLTGFFFLKT